MELEILGVTTCPTCNKRFRLQKKHKSFVGKQIQCPKCHRPFVVHLESPTPIEQAAIANSAVAAGASGTTAPSHSANGSSDDDTKAKKKRRSKFEVRKARYKEIKEEFRPFLKRLRAIAEIETSSEEEVRRWCVDVLRSVLGYEDGDLDTEMYALNQRIDIAVKHDGKVILIIECKNARTKITNSVRSQAVMYAANKSADWVVLTNGQEWSLHRVIPVKGHDPRVVDVFAISLLDDDGLSMYDVERMYLLTQRALLRGETEREFHIAQCLDDQRVLNTLSSDRVISAIRKGLVQSYRKEFSERVKLTNEDVAECLKALTRPDDL